MDTSTEREPRDTSKPRCGPCWRHKKGCDGNMPLCKRCELTGRDCDWPEEAQYSSSPAKESPTSTRDNAESKMPDKTEMPVRKVHKRKREPEGEKVRRNVIIVPRSPPGDVDGKTPTDETLSKDSDNPALGIKITDPVVKASMSTADLKTIEEYHRSYLQAQQDYLFAKRGGDEQELKDAHDRLQPFALQFDQVGAEYDEFLKTAGTIIDYEDGQRFKPIDLPWDQYLGDFQTDCIDAAINDVGNSAGPPFPPMPSMNVDRADPALANSICNWNWDGGLQDRSRNPTLPPMMVDHPEFLEAITPNTGPYMTEDTDYPTLAGVADDELFAGEGYEAPVPNEFDQEFAALQAPDLVKNALEAHELEQVAMPDWGNVWDVDEEGLAKGSELMTAQKLDEIMASFETDIS